MPETTGPDVTVDGAKLKALIEVVEGRGSFVAVIPDKGMVLMTKNKDGSYRLSIDGVDGSNGDYTIDAEGNLLKVGETDIKDISSYHEAKINMLNEYLQALSPEQIKLKEIPVGQIPDLKPSTDDALVKTLTDHGNIPKTQLITAVTAAIGGTKSQLREVVENSQGLHPGALTPELFDSVRQELLSEAATTTVNPEAQIKINREYYNTAFQLANPELSQKLTKMYQSISGDTSTTVVVSSSAEVEDSIAIQIGDGNVIFSEKFYNSMVKNFPDPADQERIIGDILKHEQRHYTHSDIIAKTILQEAQTKYIQRLENDLSTGSITKDEAVARVYASTLLIMAEQRDMERRADGSSGLGREAVNAIEKFQQEQRDAANGSLTQRRIIPPDAGGGLLLSHPDTEDRGPK